MPPRKQAASPRPLAPGHSPVRGLVRSPAGGRARGLKNLVSSPRSPPAFRTELSLPVDPEIEKGYMQAIIQSFDRARKFETIPLPDGYSSWAKVPKGLSNYVAKNELAELQEELPVDLKDNSYISDYNERVKPVAANFAQASGMLHRTIFANGCYGRVEGMRMGTATMQLYYVVQFTNGFVQHFQNFEIEQLVVSKDFGPATGDTDKKKGKAKMSASMVKTKAQKGKKDGKKDKNFPCKCGHRHFSATTCDENRELVELMATPPLAPRMGDPFKLPENAWMQEKENQMAELDQILGNPRRKSALEMEAKHARRFNSEDVSEFEEPILRAAPREPTIPQASMPNKMVLTREDPNAKLDTKFTKSILRKVDDGF